ncbi:hypothetical protein J4455_04020 [Candidatus Woesearchaeota archaeon]|nr:hypothetical protein [Candidatus Woesearchaeota archaeon]
MNKRGLNSLDIISLILLIVLIILTFTGVFYEKEIKGSPTALPTVHEFYGSVTCINNQQIINGHNLIAKLGSNNYIGSIDNGNYHLFVENGVNGQNIDFYIDNENVEDSTFQSFGFTQKNFIISNIYCANLPGINGNSPIDNQQITQNSVDVTFTNLNFIIGSIGETHLHFYIDSDVIPYMFYNGNSNIIQYNNLVSSNAQRLSANSFRITGLNDGNHIIRLILANIDHTELQNLEAVDSILFNVNTQVPSGSSGGGGSGGGGGGGSRIREQCNDLRDNDNDTKVDYPEDQGCSSRLDDNEINPVQIIYKCDDRIDNDLDNLVDLEDPGCVNSNDNSEENSFINETSSNDTRLPIIPTEYNFENTKNIILIIIISLVLVVLVVFLIYFKRKD